MFIFSLALILSPIALCIRSQLSLSISDHISTYLINDFGMARGGIVNIVQHQQMPFNALNTTIMSYVLILLIGSEQKSNLYVNLDKDMSYLCSQPSWLRFPILIPDIDTGSISYEIEYLDRYSVAALNCNDDFNFKMITNFSKVDLEIVLTNPTNAGLEQYHLPIEEVMVLRISAAQIIFYAILLLGLYLQLALAR